MSSKPSPDIEPETLSFTEVRTMVELLKRKLVRACRNASEYYEDYMNAKYRLDHYHENKICPICAIPGCGKHCNICGGEIVFTYKDKVLVDKTTGKQRILNLDGTEHMLCSLEKPFGIPDLDDELNAEYKKKFLARIAGTRIWMNADDYYTKRNL